MKNHYELGMIGLGVMGRNLLLNMADRGFSVAGYDKDPGRVQALDAEAEGAKVHGAKSLDDFLSALQRPRAMMMLVPAGAPVDGVIRDLSPHLEAGDLLIDGGNSYFKDTDLRMKTLADKGVHYLGVGISGGEYGARHGPSLMPGGPREGYERMRPIFQAAAAKVNGEPCAAYLGQGSAGHYVKMVHNGIEYGLMQLIAETYDLLKRGLGLDNDALHEIYDRWNQGELSGYLMEITGEIFLRRDDKTGQRLIDVILDAAKQKGTGKWTSQDAMDLGVPAPAIDIAVAMRHLSALQTEREAVGAQFKGPEPVFQGDRSAFIEQLRRALYAATIMVYAQGFAQLSKASVSYGYDLPLEAIARIWRGGCIIRSALLEPIRAAFSARPNLPHLLADPHLAQQVTACLPDLRAVASSAARWGIPVPGLMVSLAYFDSYRSPWLPVNLIQAQRDYFGAHTYERVDEKGVFHTEWRAE